MVLLACNPFGDDSPADEVNEAQVVAVGNQISPARSSQGSQSDQAPAELSLAEATSTESSRNPESEEETPPPTLMMEGAAVAFAPEEARNLVWAYLSQCISLTVAELEAHEIRGEWFVQATGDAPDKYGLWKVDLATGTVQPHNIRAREWDPLVNPGCTRELFSGFFTPTPPPLLNSAVTEASHAATTLWATLVKCNPTMRVEDWQATLNTAKAEWVVTAKPEVKASYGVWIVRGDGRVVPFNRQAQALYQQLDLGLC